MSHSSFELPPSQVDLRFLSPIVDHFLPFSSYV